MSDKKRPAPRILSHSVPQSRVDPGGQWSINGLGGPSYGNQKGPSCAGTPEFPNATLFAKFNATAYVEHMKRLADVSSPVVTSGQSARNGNFGTENFATISGGRSELGRRADELSRSGENPSRDSGISSGVSVSPPRLERFDESDSFLFSDDTSSGSSEADFPPDLSFHGGISDFTKSFLATDPVVCQKGGIDEDRQNKLEQSGRVKTKGALKDLSSPYQCNTFGSNATGGSASSQNLPGLEENPGSKAPDPKRDEHIPSADLWSVLQSAVSSLPSKKRQDDSIFDLLVQATAQQDVANSQSYSEPISPRARSARLQKRAANQVENVSRHNEERAKKAQCTNWIPPSPVGPDPGFSRQSTPCPKGETEKSWLLANKSPTTVDRGSNVAAGYASLDRLTAMIGPGVPHGEARLQAIQLLNKAENVDEFLSTEQKEILSLLSSPDDALPMIQLLQKLGFLARSMNCINCKQSMVLKRRGSQTDGWAWRCDTKGCRLYSTIRSARTQSLFWNSRFSLQQWLQVMCLCLLGTSEREVARALRTPLKTIAEMYRTILTMDEEERSRFQQLVDQYESAAGDAAHSDKPKRKPKKVKDPAAPKKYMSAYFFFAAEQRGSVAQANPEMKVADIAREMGRMWRELEPEARAVYERKSVEDRRRYEEELAAYKSGAPTPAGPSGHNAPTPNHPDIPGPSSAVQNPPGAPGAAQPIQPVVQNPSSNE